MTTRSKRSIQPPRRFDEEDFSTKRPLKETLRPVYRLLKRSDVTRELLHKKVYILWPIDDHWYPAKIIELTIKAMKAYVHYEESNEYEELSIQDLIDQKQIAFMEYQEASNPLDEAESPVGKLKILEHEAPLVSPGIQLDCDDTESASLGDRESSLLEAMPEMMVTAHFINTKAGSHQEEVSGDQVVLTQRSPDPPSDDMDITQFKNAVLAHMEQRQAELVQQERQGSQGAAISDQQATSQEKGGPGPSSDEARMLLPPANDIQRKAYEQLVAALQKAVVELQCEGHEGQLPDPHHIGVLVEREIFRLYGAVNKDYKSKCRSLLFNLKDVNNPELRAKVLHGEVSPAQLVALSPAELASRELSLWRQKKAEELSKAVVLDAETAARFSTAAALALRAKVEDGGPRNPSPPPATLAPSLSFIVPQTSEPQEPLWTTLSGVRSPRIERGEEGVDGTRRDREADVVPLNLPDALLEQPVNRRRSVDNVLTGIDWSFIREQAAREASSCALSAGQNGCDEVPPDLLASTAVTEDGDLQGVPGQVALEARNKLEHVELVGGDQATELPPVMDLSPLVLAPPAGVSWFLSQEVWRGKVQSQELASFTMTCTAIGGAGDLNALLNTEELEVRGRVSLDKVQTYLEDLRKSRGRTVSLGLLRLVQGATMTDTTCLNEMVKHYASRSRCGVLQLSAGVEGYLIAKCHLTARLVKTAVAIVPADLLQPHLSTNIGHDELLLVLIHKKDWKSPKAAREVVALNCQNIISAGTGEGVDPDSCKMATGASPLLAEGPPNKQNPEGGVSSENPDSAPSSHDLHHHSTSLVATNGPPLVRLDKACMPNPGSLPLPGGDRVVQPSQHMGASVKPEPGGHDEPQLSQGPAVSHHQACAPHGKLDDHPGALQTHSNSSLLASAGSWKELQSTPSMIAAPHLSVEDAGRALGLDFNSINQLAAALGLQGGTASLQQIDYPVQEALRDTGPVGAPLNPLPPLGAAPSKSTLDQALVALLGAQQSGPHAPHLTTPHGASVGGGFLEQQVPDQQPAPVAQATSFGPPQQGTVPHLVSQHLAPTPTQVDAGPRPEIHHAFPSLGHASMDPHMPAPLYFPPELGPGPMQAQTIMEQPQPANAVAMQWANPGPLLVEGQLGLQGGVPPFYAPTGPGDLAGPHGAQMVSGDNYVYPGHPPPAGEGVPSYMVPPVPPVPPPPPLPPKVPRPMVRITPPQYSVPNSTCNQLPIYGDPATKEFGINYDIFARPPDAWWSNKRNRAHQERNVHQPWLDDECSELGEQVDGNSERFRQVRKALNETVRRKRHAWLSEQGLPVPASRPDGASDDEAYGEGLDDDGLVRDSPRYLFREQDRSTAGEGRGFEETDAGKSRDPRKSLDPQMARDPRRVTGLGQSSETLVASDPRRCAEVGLPTDPRRQGGPRRPTEVSAANAYTNGERVLINSKGEQIVLRLPCKVSKPMSSGENMESSTRLALRDKGPVTPHTGKDRVEEPGGPKRRPAEVADPVPPTTQESVKRQRSIPEEGNPITGAVQDDR